VSLRSRPTLQVAIALLAGFVAGMVLRGTPVPRWIEPLGTLWINAIRMPVLPLIVTMLIASIAGSRDPRQVGTLGARTLMVMLALLSVFALIMAPLSKVLLGGLSFDPASTAALREAARFDPNLLQQVSLREWLLSLVPNNPIRAAADGALLPLVIFSLAYGLALSRVSEGIRETHVRFCQGVADAMATIIRWVVVVAPIGVFALAISVGARLGAAAAGAIIVYIVACVVALSIAIALLYVITTRLGGVSLRELGSAILPAQTPDEYHQRADKALQTFLLRFWSQSQNYLRADEPEIGLVLLRTEGDPEAVLAATSKQRRAVVAADDRERRLLLDTGNGIPCNLERRVEGEDVPARLDRGDPHHSPP